jgi:hypothetical protein
LACALLSRHAVIPIVKLSPLFAGAISAAIIAGITVWTFAQLSGLWVWAAFVGWASYDHSGANRMALFTSSTCMVFGVVMAWLVALVVAGGLVPIANSISSAVAAAVASFIIVCVSRYLPFSNVPATFYGFASAFAFLLLVPRAFSMEAMTANDLRNVLICVPVSLLIGSVLGVVHQQFASLLTAPEQRPLPPVATRLTPLKREA